MNKIDINKEKLNILRVKIDKVTMEGAIELIQKWLESGENKKRYIVTPNIEFIMAAQIDPDFRRILNNSDLNIPDSARFGWAKAVIEEKVFVKRILIWPLFIFPGLFKYPKTTGIDLMVELCKLSNDKGFTVGLLGGYKDIAEKSAKCLNERFPDLKINFINSGGVVKTNGIMEDLNLLKDIKSDILFVAFGQVKQEKWIYRYKDQVDAKVFMGVGGAFDYISGSVQRAPKVIQNLGFEWLFRLIIQPWRITRFKALTEFIFKILVK